jgi:hypothetical protein
MGERVALEWNSDSGSRENSTNKKLNIKYETRYFSPFENHL